MSKAVAEERDFGPLFDAAMRGWGAAVAACLLLFVLLGLAALAWGYWPIRAELVGQIVGALLALAVLTLIVGFVTLPLAMIGSGLLWLGERLSRRTCNLAAWFAAGFVMSLPLTSLAWHAQAMQTAHADRSGLFRPFLWVNLWPPLLILAFALFAAFVAWRWRRARLAA